MSIEVSIEYRETCVSPLCIVVGLVYIIVSGC